MRYAHVSSANVPGIPGTISSQMFTIADDELSQFSSLLESPSSSGGPYVPFNSADFPALSPLRFISGVDSASESVSSAPGASAKSTRKRAWVFTLNNYSDSDLSRLSLLCSSGKCKYIVYGLESAPTTGTRHLQGFVFFNDAKTRSAVKKIIGEAHLEFSKDDPKRGFSSAIEYCRKGGEFFEFGDAPSGLKERGDASKDMWDSMKESAKKGMLDEIPSVFLVRYYNTFKAIRKDYMLKPADSPTVTGVWVQGEAGCGKSRYVRSLVGSDFYRKMRNHWWDGYQQEPFVICDDLDKFNVSLGGLIKDWTDRYSFTAEAKGGAMSIRPKLVFFTSQYAISDIWSDRETADALLRRCVVVNFFDPQMVLPTLENIISQLNLRNLNL